MFGEKKWFQKCDKIIIFFINTYIGFYGYQYAYNTKLFDLNVLVILKKMYKIIIKKYFKRIKFLWEKTT